MESLTVASTLAIINNINYDDNRKVRDIILREELKSVFHIKSKTTNKEYFIRGYDRDDAITRFVESNKMLTYSTYDGVFTVNKCNICDTVKNCKEEDHLKTHSYTELLNFHIKLFERRYVCSMITFEPIEFYSILDRLKLDTCALEKDLKPLYTVRPINRKRSMKIRADNEDELIKIIIKRESLMLFNFAYEIHIKLICKGGCEKCPRSIKLCTDCKDNGTCFICNRKLNLLGDKQLGRLIYYHFHTHSNIEINLKLLMQHIKTLYDIKLENIYEDEDKVQEIQKLRKEKILTK